VENKIGMGVLSSLSNGNQPVGHVHVFNSPAILHLLKLNEYIIVEKLGLSVDFISPGRPFLTAMYRLIDTFFSIFFTLSADLIILAKKE